MICDDEPARRLVKYRTLLSLKGVVELVYVHVLIVWETSVGNRVSQAHQSFNA